MKRLLFIGGLIGLALFTVFFALPYHKMKTIDDGLKSLFVENISTDFEISDSRIKDKAIYWSDVTFDEDEFLSAKNIHWVFSEEPEELNIDGLELLISSKDNLSSTYLSTLISRYAKLAYDAGIPALKIQNLNATIFTQNYGDVVLNSDFTLERFSGGYVLEGSLTLKSSVLNSDMNIKGMVNDDVQLSFEIMPSKLHHPKFIANRFLGQMQISNTTGTPSWSGDLNVASASILDLPFGNLKLKILETGQYTLTGHAIDSQNISFTFNSATQKGTLRAKSSSALLEFISRSKYDLLAPQDSKALSQTSNPEIKFQISNDMKRLGYAYEDPLMKSTVQRMVILSED